MEIILNSHHMNNKPHCARNHNEVRIDDDKVCEIETPSIERAQEWHDDNDFDTYEDAEDWLTWVY